MLPDRILSILSSCFPLNYPHILIEVFFVVKIPRCAPCPAGYKCENASQPPVPCHAGSFSLEGETGCTLCDPGQACTDPGQAPRNCSEGTYSGQVSVP